MSLNDEIAAIIRPIVKEAIREAFADQVAKTLTPAESDVPVYLTFARAAELADVSTKTIATWVRRGWIRRHGPKGAERLRLDEFQAFMSKPADEVESQLDADTERVQDLRSRLGLR